MDKISEALGTLPGLAAHLSFLKWISLEYRHIVMYSNIHLGYKVAYALLS